MFLFYNIVEMIIREMENSNDFQGAGAGTVGMRSTRSFLCGDGTVLCYACGDSVKL